MKVQYNIDGMHNPGTEIEIGGTSTLLGATIHSFTVSTWLSLKVGASACISARAMVFARQLGGSSSLHEALFSHKYADDNTSIEVFSAK